MFSSVPSREYPPLDPAKGRVFIYRNSSMGSPYVPEVLLNGENVGKLDRVGVIFRDVPPGSYAVTATRISKVVNFAVAAGDRKYIKFSSGYFETFMHPELVEAKRGESEAAGLRIVMPGQK
jgi:hypothetical protein